MRRVDRASTLGLGLGALAGALGIVMAVWHGASAPPASITGAAPLLNAIVGGHVTAGVSGIGEFAEQIKGGRMRALAVSSPAKFDGYPSLKEQGIDDDG